MAFIISGFIILVGAAIFFIKGSIMDSPSIELVQEKLEDKESNDNVDEAVKDLKIVNK